MSTYDALHGIIRDPQGRFAGRIAAGPAAQLDERYRELQSTGAVRARSIVRSRVGTSRHFWRDARATAPIDLKHPAPKISQAPAGQPYRLRTYRGAGGNTLRMPSVAALNRMADVEANQFDIPVQAGRDGQHVTGWVRVARSAHGAWSVRAHGMDTRTAAMAQRQVSWVLGSDHPSFAMNEAGTYSQLVAEQDRRRGVEPVALDSQAVSEAAYDGGTSTLFVTLRERDGAIGSTYGWRAPRDVYERMISGSAGRVLSGEVVRKWPKVESEQCPRCGRFWAVTGGRDHDCPARLESTGSGTGMGDDRVWAASLAAEAHGGRSDLQLAQALEDHMVEPPSIAFATLRVDPGRLGSGRRFKGLSGPAATRVLRSLGDQSYRRVPAPAEVLGAAESDERVSITGRLDHEGLSIEEVVFADASSSTADEAWQELRRTSHLPTTPDYDVARRDRHGAWRFYFAPTSAQRAA